MKTRQYLYTICKKVLCLKLRGNITYMDSYPFDHFSRAIFREPAFTSVLIDLSQTTGIDSTNLGILARIGTAARALSGEKAVIITTTPDITRTLESMGFTQVFSFMTETAPPTPPLKPLPPAAPEEVTGLAETILEAHRELMAISKENEKTFRSVVDFMEKDIAKLKTRKKTSGRGAE